MEQLEEVVIKGTYTYAIHFDDEGIVHHDIGVMDGGSTSHYQCAECGFIPANPDKSFCRTIKQLKVWMDYMNHTKED